MSDTIGKVRRIDRAADRALDASLVAYYEQECALGRRSGLGPLRARLRSEFSALLAEEGRHTLVDVGAGPGRDAVVFRAEGFAIVGLDLTPGHANAMHSAGVRAVAASLFHPPFPSGSFDAVWTMSTLVHVPDARLDEALAAITGLARPGAPVGIGTWGGVDFEGISEHGDIRPYRFFAVRAHDRMRDALAEHGVVEHFETAHPSPEFEWEYQFAVVRRR